jgi:hypothetical protein
MKEEKKEWIEVISITTLSSSELWEGSLMVISMSTAHL